MNLKEPKPLAGLGGTPAFCSIVVNGKDVVNGKNGARVVEWRVVEWADARRHNESISILQVATRFPPIG
jgi:hypothetical protein